MGKSMERYQKAFLFNGIGARPDKLLKDMSPRLREKVSTYQEEVFRRYGLPMELDTLVAEDRLIAEWLISSICDRVIFEYYGEQNIIPDIGAGYSSGIVTISACFGAIDYLFAYDIIRRNKKIMELIGRENVHYDMGVIIGIEPDVVREMIRACGFSDEVVIGSVNSFMCVMISGLAEAVDVVLERALSEGALRVNLLHTKMAFHHPVMERYAADYISFCGQGVYDNPRYPIISIFDQSIMTTKQEIMRENQVNIVSPIRWDKTIDHLQELGVTEFFDISANGAAQKFSRVRRHSAKIYHYLDI